MNRNYARAAVVGATLSIAGGAVAAPTDADLQRCLAAAADASGLNGVAVIAHNGTVVASVGRGSMGPGDARPIALDARFNIASVGKMFTATAIAQLVEAGKVRFEDPVGKFLPDAPAFMAGLRVDQLLTHTSGLGDAIFGHREASEAAQSVGELLKLVYSDPPAGPPGSAIYSNSGYVVLGAVVEKASGEAYADYLARHIFAPAGMSATALRADLTRTATPVTTMPGAVAPANSGMSSPAGGAYSTAADLVAFVRALAAGSLVSADAVMAKVPGDAARAPGPTIGGGAAAPAAPGAGTAAGGPQRVIVGPGAGAGPAEAIPGLGFVLGTGSLTYGGGAPGVNSAVGLFPRYEWTVVVIANRDPPAAQMFAMRISPWISAAACS